MGLEKKSKDETICEFIKFSKKNENEKGFSIINIMVVNL
jgi:hypothetical protein